MRRLTIGFVGLGLIGGSIAKALRRSVTGIKIIAYDTCPETPALAVRDGVADIAAANVDTSFSSCDFIFLCAPVEENDKNLIALKDFLPPSCILTDVGSVKGGIHRSMDAAGLSGQFIGGHPMAGSERTGYANSKARLLENAYYILTPSPYVAEKKIDAYKELVVSMGAIPLVLDAFKHDYVTAAVSHLPHLIASSLVNLIHDSDSESGIMKMVAAGGFKDITRIASSSPDMWRQICLNNTDNILTVLDAYMEALHKIRKTLTQKDADGLYDFFNEARNYRDSFAFAPSGPIKSSYSITIDIADETGALASVATILALNNISIKNIGIVHNRELEEGALRIEFYEEAAIKKAKSILSGKGYLFHP